MPLLRGIHTTERAAGRAGNLDSPASGAMAVPSSAFSGLAQGVGMATGQPQGEGATSLALSSGARAIYVALSGPSQHSSASLSPWAPEPFVSHWVTSHQQNSQPGPFLWALGPSLSHWVTSHYQNPQLGLFLWALEPSLSPLNGVTGGLLAIAPRHGSEQNSRSGAGPITKCGSSACLCHLVHRLGSAASSAFNSNSGLPEHS